MTIHVLGVLDEFANEDMPKWAPLQLRGFKMLGWKKFAYAPDLRRYLFELEPEIVHTHGIWEYPSVAVSAWHRKYRRPYMISPHGMLDTWAVRNSFWKKKVAWTLYEQEHLAQASCIRSLCVSEAISIRKLGLKNPICILPNGIDLSPEIDHGQLANQSSPVRSLAEGRKILLYLGRLHPKKGLIALLRAWKRALDLQPLLSKSWILVIAGWDQGAHEAQLKRQATDLGIPWGDSASLPQKNNSLLFVGPQFGEAKTLLYSDCDAFILPSLSEGLPMVILEAWAHGKPVVMTPECNLPEGFDAAAALRIEPNMESIAAGLMQLCDMSQDERVTMGKRGMALVRNRFSWNRIATDMKSVYEWMLGGGNKPDCVQNF